MGLRDNLYMSTCQLVDSLDKCNDAGLERIQTEISEYMRICEYVTKCIENNMTEEVKSIYIKNNVLVHKMTGRKHVVSEQEFLDEYNVYDFVCETPHSDGKYNYLCGDPKCKCVRYANEHK